MRAVHCDIFRTCFASESYLSSMNIEERETRNPMGKTKRLSHWQKEATPQSAKACRVYPVRLVRPYTCFYNFLSDIEIWSHVRLIFYQIVCMGRVGE